METAHPGIWHRRLKLIWLLSHALTFPLAVLYFARNPMPGLAPAVAAAAGFLCAATAPVLWIIAEAMLIMYRFPLTSRGAAVVVVGFYVQLAALVLTGESVGFAMFVSVYATLAASFACLLPLLVHLQPAFLAARRGALARCGTPLRFLIGLLVFIPPATLYPVLFAGFARMQTAGMICSAGIALANTILTMKELAGLSIFGVQDLHEGEYRKAWEQWAGPTVVVLIVSVVAGVVLAGLLHG